MRKSEPHTRSRLKTKSQQKVYSSIIQTWIATAATDASKANRPIPIPTEGAACTWGATEIAELVEADLEAGTAATEAPGFFWKWTDAWGNGFEPAALGGTFAVSFLGSETRGGGAAATDGALPVPAGGIVADGTLKPGGFGAGGTVPASEAGLADAGGGGTLATAGGFGIETLPGMPGGGGGGKFTAPEAPVPAAGGLGTGVITPGSDGGFGGTGGAGA